MPVLFQLFQCSRFALSFGARYRHVAFGLRGTWNCDVFARRILQAPSPVKPEEQCEQRTEINEPAFEPPSSRGRGITASQEAMAGICGSAFAKATADRFRGGFLFHYLNLGLCEAHSRGVETLSAPLCAGWMLWIQETSRCRKDRSSCWAEFGQAFSTLKSKITRCDTWLPAEAALPRCLMRLAI